MTDLQPSLLNLMWRYCAPYTNAHDLSLLEDLMVPGYVLHMGSYHVEGRDGAYRSAASAQFEQFPHLALTVHRVITDGTRLAMVFSEHGSSIRHEGRAAAWRGIALYRWDGERLVECFVEQDYYSRARQLRTGTADPVPRPAVAPWSTAHVAADASNEAVVRQWLDSGPLAERAGVRCDASDIVGWEEPVLDDAAATIRDVFSCGNEVAFSVELTGRVAGGLVELDDHRGATASIVVNGIATVDGGAVVDCEMVADRLGMCRSVQRAGR